MYGTACYVKSGSGGQVGVSLVMLCYVSLRRSCRGSVGYVSVSYGLAV